MNPLLAVTMGDPAGVGAEIVVKALSRPGVYSRAQPFVIGNAACLKIAMQQTGVEIPIVIRSSVKEVTPESDVMQVLEPIAFDADHLVMGAGLCRLWPRCRCVLRIIGEYGIGG